MDDNTKLWQMLGTVAVVIAIVFVVLYIMQAM